MIINLTKMKNKHQKRHQKEKNKVDRIATVICYSLLSLIFIYSFMNGFYIDYKLKTDSAIVNGKIVDCHMDLPHTPKCEFVYTYKYKGIEYKRSMWKWYDKNEDRYKIGECVQVIVCRSKPKISKIYSEWSYKCSDTDSSATP